ncbi:MAG: alpha/beta hydrolase [Pseudomonadales bacterium]|nr:alpha/beta hydrolase [Pseudomonadales bacterium]
MTFVLVHGAWHGGWCWQRVADILLAHGHRVFAPTLTGLGERSHVVPPDLTLSTHIMDVVNEVKWKDLDGIVLCGHSYGGLVISGVAEHIADRIAAMVYLDAFVPRDGESLLDAGGHAQPGPDGVMVTPISATYFNVNAADRDWVDAKMTLQPIACFRERLTLSGAHETIASKTYVRATGFALPGFDACRERCRANPDWRVLDIDCGHDVMIDKPLELANILMTA